MNDVESFIMEHDGNQRKLLQYLHNLLISFPDLHSKITYRIPFYYRKSWICYLNPLKNNKVEFAFTRGNELSNQQGLLTSRGRKQVMSIEFENIKNIPQQSIVELIHEAIILDDTIPYLSKRSVKKKR